MTKPLTQPHPLVERFTAVSATFLRGRGTDDDPVRQCTAYYREEPDGEMQIIAIYDPSLGIDPMRFPPGEPWTMGGDR